MLNSGDSDDSGDEYVSSAIETFRSALCPTQSNPIQVSESHVAGIVVTSAHSPLSAAAAEHAPLLAKRGLFVPGGDEHAISTDAPNSPASKASWPEAVTSEIVEDASVEGCSSPSSPTDAVIFSSPSAAAEINVRYGFSAAAVDVEAMVSAEGHPHFSVALADALELAKVPTADLESTHRMAMISAERYPHSSVALADALELAEAPTADLESSHRLVQNLPVDAQEGRTILGHSSQLFGSTHRADRMSLASVASLKLKASSMRKKAAEALRRNSALLEADIPQDIDAEALHVIANMAVNPPVSKSAAQWTTSVDMGDSQSNESAASGSDSCLETCPAPISEQYAASDRNSADEPPPAIGIKDAAQDSSSFVDYVAASAFTKAEVPAPVAAQPALRSGRPTDADMELRKTMEAAARRASELEAADDAEWQRLQGVQRRRVEQRETCDLQLRNFLAARTLTPEERIRTFLETNGFEGVNIKRRKLLKTFYPLHVAVKQRDADLVRFLLQAGADPSKKNSSGETPFVLAQKCSSQGSHDAILAALRGHR